MTCPHLKIILNFVLGNQNSAKLRSASVTVISLGLGQCRHAWTNVSRQRCASQPQLVAQVLPATTVLFLVCPLLVAEFTRRFRLPSLHILHVRCKFCVFRAVGRNLQFLHVWARLREKSIVHRDGQAQERAQEKIERNRRWFERKKSTFLVRAANAPVRAAKAPYEELHTSTNLRSLDHERGEHTTRRLWSGRGLGQSRTNLRRSKALRWTVCLSIVDTSFCSGPDSADIVKSSLYARFQACSVKKSRPCQGTFARASQADRCMNLLQCAQRSTPWLLDTRGCECKVECFSLFERYVTLPVGTWLIALEQSSRSHVCCVLRNLPTSSFGKRKKRFR